MAKKVEAKSRWVRRRAEQGLALVAQYRASGESAAGFCRRAGVGLHVLRYWLSKRVEPNEHPSEFFVVSPLARESQVGGMEGWRLPRRRAMLGVEAPSS
jgi:hypothetical protein